MTVSSKRAGFKVLTGRGAGLVGVIKNDRLMVRRQALRSVELWQALGAEPEAGDAVRIEAGCDKREDTCRLKFANFVNFQGFPHIPGRGLVDVLPGGRASE